MRIHLEFIMKDKTMPTHPFYMRGLRALILFALFGAGFLAGLVALSFFDDLVQYQALISSRASLIVGVGFGLICGLICVLAGRRLWPVRG